MKERRKRSQDIIPSIGIKMKEVRKKHKMTLKDISKILGVSHQQVQRYEALQVEVPLYTLWFFAKYFEINVEEFLP